MAGPQVTEWGPRLWRLFHSLTEQTGRGKYRTYNDEEKRVWINLINSLLKTLPCPKCRHHFKEHLKSHPFESTLIKNGEERRIELRTWFWTFHNNVRLRKEQPIELTYEQVELMYTTYTRKDFDADMAVLKDHMRRGMFQRWLICDDMYRTLRAFEEIWRILNH